MKVPKISLANANQLEIILRIPCSVIIFGILSKIFNLMSDIHNRLRYRSYIAMPISLACEYFSLIKGHRRSKRPLR